MRSNGDRWSSRRHSHLARGGFRFGVFRVSLQWSFQRFRYIYTPVRGNTAAISFHLANIGRYANLLRRTVFPYPSQRVFGYSPVLLYYSARSNFGTKSISALPTVFDGRNTPTRPPELGIVAVLARHLRLLLICAIFPGFDSDQVTSKSRQVSRVSLRLYHRSFTDVYRFVMFVELRCSPHGRKQVTATAHGHHRRNSSCNGRYKVPG